MEEAQALAASVLEADPENSEALLTLARLALVQGDLEAAEPYLQQAETVEISVETRLTRAALAAARGQRSEAEAGYAAILQAQPDRPEALFGLASALAEERRYEASLPLFLRLTQLLPGSGRLHYHLARNFMELSRPSEALESLARSLEEDPQLVEAYLVASRILRANQRAEEARELVQKGLGLMPEQPQLINELTGLHLLCGDAQAAGQTSQTLAESLPGNAAVLANAANVLLVQARFQEALALCQQASEKNASIWMIQGTACEELGDLEQAREAYYQACLCKDATWGAANNLGLVLLRQSQDRQAESCFQLARRQAPGQPEPLLNLAIVYARGAQHSKARRCVARLLKKSQLPQPIAEQARSLLTVLESTQEGNAC